MLIEWKDEYSVGVKEIDEQHKKAVALINDLSDIISGQKDKKEIERIVKELMDYADYHFSTEEKYFDKFNFEGAEEHKVAHREYVAKISTYQKNNGNEIETAFEVMDYLQDWWVNHINDMDKKYTKTFNENGLY